MQGIVILGGKGTRLNLFSRRVNNKALAIVYKNLVFEYPLNTLVKAGITDITMVLGYRYAGHLMDVVGDGKEFGVKKINYVYQKEAAGISHAIKQAQGHITEKCAVILGDNFFEDSISDAVKQFEEQDAGCGIFLKEVPDPERYGVAEVISGDSGLKVTNIVEKPSQPKTNLAVTGLYFYDTSVFERIDQLKPSARGEYEVTDLNMSYVLENRCVAHSLKGYWNDMGTFDSILDTGNFIRDHNFRLNYTINAWES